MKLLLRLHQVKLKTFQETDWSQGSRLETEDFLELQDFRNSTLATAVVLLVMGGALSEPQVIADAHGLSSALAFISPFTWASGEKPGIVLYAIFVAEDGLNPLASTHLLWQVSFFLQISLGCFIVEPGAPCLVECPSVRIYVEREIEICHSPKY